MAVSLACGPVVYPWYLLWLVPFVGAVSTLPLLIWTLSILPVFFVWYAHALGQPWQVPGWILLLEYGSVAVAGIAWIRRRRAVTLVQVENCEKNASSFLPLDPAD